VSAGERPLTPHNPNKGAAAEEVSRGTTPPTLDSWFPPYQGGASFFFSRWGNAFYASPALTEESVNGGGMWDSSYLTGPTPKLKPQRVS